MSSGWQTTFHPNTWMHSVLSNPTRPPDTSPKHHSSIQVSQPAPGVIEVKPPFDTHQNLLISCGIHGNETAPIELVSLLVEDILKGILPIQTRLLIIVGHPPAIIVGQRFIKTNLNRLFGSGSSPIANLKAAHGVDFDSRFQTESEPEPEYEYEPQRAALLKKVVTDFFEDTAGPKYHLDLHTAIRPSHFEKFAVSPYGQTLDPSALSLLSASGIEAVLESHQPAGTFSYFSASEAGATAFTLELGKVARFGENDLGQISAVDRAIRTVIEGKLPDMGATAPKRFRVVKELLRESEDFELLISRDAANFTAYPEHTLIARDGSAEYRTQQPDEHVVFPNPDVPVGQRAGLMIIKI